MSSIAETKIRAYYQSGKIIIHIDDVEINFPVSKNPRLSQGTPEQLNKIEVSPFGLHWPDLDEDLSFEGFRKGNYGQK